VIGVTSAALRGGQNLNFAVPSAEVVRLLRAADAGGLGHPLPLTRRTEAEECIARGDAAYRRQAYPEAIRHYDEAARLDPTSASALRRAGWVRYVLEQYNSAICDFDAAIRLDPTHATAHRWRGDARACVGDHAEAITDFDTAVRLDPMDRENFRSRGHHWRRVGEYRKALRDHEEAVRLDTDSSDPLAQHDLAKLLACCPDAGVRDGDRAIQIAKKLCERSNYRAGLFLDLLAAGYAETGEFGWAVHYEMKALEDPSCDASLRVEFGRRLSLYRQKKPYRRTD
jgi:tetratricopeptide (TPR) repeat protein